MVENVTWKKQIVCAEASHQERMWYIWEKSKKEPSTKIQICDKTSTTRIKTWNQAYLEKINLNNQEQSI